ncbi:hypothetical protein ACTU6V_12720 [Microbacterium sp. A204]|uniref:hypothetical protein n=1 Tax=Microbacterium sp. A204 TaxID=3457321 RepID=UPI003FD10192
MTADAVQAIQGWRAADLAEPLRVPVEDVERVLNEAVASGAVIRLECGPETLYASGRIAPHNGNTP